MLTVHHLVTLRLFVCLHAYLTQSSDEAGAGDINSEVFFEEGFDVSDILGLLLFAGILLISAFIYTGIQLEVVKKLGEMGHRVETASGERVLIQLSAVLLTVLWYTGHGRGMFGRGQIIQRTVDKVTGRLVWAAGSDPRGDGHASAQI